jgi:enoyl-CoA hydratase
VETFDRLEASGDVGAFVITGAPPAFCAGADLGDLGKTGASGGSASGDQGLRSIYEGFLRVARSPLPTLAAVNGAAVGAGMNLALCCDVRLAGRSARFDTRFLKLGLHPGGGHTWMLQRAAGLQTAAAMVLFGEVLDGAAAERCGLVWRCVDDDVLLDEAKAMAARAADTPEELARRAKDVLRQMPGIPAHDAAVDLELSVQSWSAQQPFFAERLAAMRQRVQQKR